MPDAKSNDAHIVNMMKGRFLPRSVATLDTDGSDSGSVWGVCVCHALASCLRAGVVTDVGTEGSLDVRVSLRRRTWIPELLFTPQLA